MGLFGSRTISERQEREAAVAKYKAARAELERAGEADRKAGRHEETDAYLAANSAVIKAEKHVPWWRR